MMLCLLAPQAVFAETKLNFQAVHGRFGALPASQQRMGIFLG
jgi:hypothetical protein